MSAPNSAKYTGPQRLLWGGREYQIPSEDEVILAALGNRLTEARAILAAAVEDAKAAVSDAARGGMSDRRIAATLGIDRRTVRTWHGGGSR